MQEEPANAAVPPTEKPDGSGAGIGKGIGAQEKDEQTLKQREHHRLAASAPSLNAICTTDILPVDLNAFLYKLETTLERVCREEGDIAAADDYAAQAEARMQALNALCWDAKQGAYLDYNWQKGAQRLCLTAACLTPLFVGMSTQQQADALAPTVRQRLLAPGGLSTTQCGSDQQWDRPNGWAPLQWIGIRGLEAYGHGDLAQEIAHRWLHTVAELYTAEGKLVEKYALRETHGSSAHGGGGGEYPLQDGFGWTNGVTRALLAEHPAHAAHAARSSRFSERAATDSRAFMTAAIC